MSMKVRILEGQRAWARNAGLDSDRKGYLRSCEANLFQPMNVETKAAFDHGSGSELRDSARSPAKMRALHSSSALAVNFFDPWVDEDVGPLLRALGVDGASGAAIRFEAQYPTGLPGIPPNLDVALELPGGEVIAIESKFTEWLSSKAGGKAPFKEKYFPAGDGVWRAVGLEACQTLAEQINDGTETFRYPDAPQLLKHALGLATNLGNRFRLFYIYFDAACPEGEAHLEEIAKFGRAVGPEVRFRAIAYQELLRQLQEAGAGSGSYRAYLHARYFAGIA